MASLANSLALPAVGDGSSLTISASTYRDFQQCPAQAAARIDGKYPPDTRASFKGVLAHRVFARHLERGAVATDDLVRVCREEIGQALNPKLTSVGLRPSELHNVICEVGVLYERFKRFPAAGFHAAELHLAAEPWSGVKLRGVVDAVFEDEMGVRLVDWKTGHIGEAQHQMDFYAFLWWCSRGEVPARIEAISVNTGEQVAAVPTADAVAVTAQRVAAMVDELRSATAGAQEVPEVAGPWCRYCPVLATCSEGVAVPGVAAVGLR